MSSWFRLDGRVSRRAYAATGFGLMAFKYAVEALAIHFVTGARWTPLDYLSPVYSLRASKLAGAPSGFLFALGLWTLPFVWIGAAMTLRRARDAGLGSWPVVLFFAPLANYVVMLALALRGTHRRSGSTHEPATKAESEAAFDAALVTTGATAAGTLAVFTFSVFVVKSYGAMLFLGLPFVLGFEAGYVFNRKQDQGAVATYGIVSLALGLAGMMLLVFALEGSLCLLLTLPIAWPIALFGATFGRALSVERIPRSGSGTLASALLLLPLMGLEARVATPAEFEVVTTVEVDAPPERVWPNVIGFGDLPPPDNWVFATGIAYPVRAELEGTGVGAVRRCEFSTGAFVEPITAWEPLVRLAFDVREQPLPMAEWSFYRKVQPPHLAHSFRSLRGEFRLSKLPGGRTRLEGHTWYALELAPAPYWRLWCDWIVHRIHERVLAHVKRLSEA